jgi:hypothetical protein
VEQTETLGLKTKACGYFLSHNQAIIKARTEAAATLVLRHTRHHTEAPRLFEQCHALAGFGIPADFVSETSLHILS